MYWALTGMLLLGGCSYGEVDLEGRRCPCAGGWVCDTVRDVCVQRLDDAGRTPDARTPDASRMDATVAADAPMDAPGGGDGPHADAGSDAPLALDGGRDAGLDAAPPDAGPDDTACDDRYLGAIFCDGIEDLGLIAWSETRARDGTASRMTAEVWRGRGALAAQTTAPSGNAMLAADIAPIGSGDLWWRAYVYLPSGYPAHTLSLLYVGERVDPYDGVSFQVVSGDAVHVWIGPASLAVTAAFVRAPRDRWFCAETHVVVSDTDGLVEGYVDGVLALRQAGVDTRPAADFGTLSVGLEWTSASQDPATVYVDEVVVATTRPGCD